MKLQASRPRDPDADVATASTPYMRHSEEPARGRVRICQSQIKGSKCNWGVPRNRSAGRRPAATRPELLSTILSFDATLLLLAQQLKRRKPRFKFGNNTGNAGAAQADELFEIPPRGGVCNVLKGRDVGEPRRAHQKGKSDLEGVENATRVGLWGIAFD